MIKQPSIHDLERTIELDFVRATEAAALHVFKWIGKGEKNKADGAACDAIEGMFDLIEGAPSLKVELHPPGDAVVMASGAGRSAERGSSRRGQ